jgi:hypothetical protein
MANALPMNRSIIALARTLTASPTVAGREYPPGLFENSPLVPSGPPTQRFRRDQTRTSLLNLQTPTHPLGLQMRPRLSDPRMRSTQRRHGLSHLSQSG